MKNTILYPDYSKEATFHSLLWGELFTRNGHLMRKVSDIHSVNLETMAVVIIEPNSKVKYVERDLSWPNVKPLSYGKMIRLNDLKAGEFYTRDTSFPNATIFMKIDDDVSLDLNIMYARVHNFADYEMMQITEPTPVTFTVN